MATNQPTNAPVNQFHLYDFVATEITDTFNRLIEQLIASRDALLSKLQTMKEDFVTKETTRIATIAELERVIRQMREESMKVNVNLETQEKALQVYLDEMERHQTSTKLLHPGTDWLKYSARENIIKPAHFTKNRFIFYTKFYDVRG